MYGSSTPLKNCSTGTFPPPHTHTYTRPLIHYPLSLSLPSRDDFHRFSFSPFLLSLSLSLSLSSFFSLSLSPSLTPPLGLRDLARWYPINSCIHFAFVSIFLSDTHLHTHTHIPFHSPPPPFLSPSLSLSRSLSLPSLRLVAAIKFHIHKLPFVLPLCHTHMEGESSLFAFTPSPLPPPPLPPLHFADRYTYRSHSREMEDFWKVIQLRVCVSCVCV